MKVFTRDYKIEHINSPIYGEYYDGMKSCVLDIEATGLDPKTSKVVLMGLLTETESGVKVTQFLAENHYEEDKVLMGTMEFLHDNKIDYLVTFNGLRYDIPYINTRLEILNFEDRIKLYDFDLYRFLRKCSILPSKMDSLRQSAVEDYFGIGTDRKDTITGKENIALFNEYSISGNSTVEKIILTHNREDVLQLYKLMKLCSKNEFADILDIDFHEAIARYGFPACNGRFSLRPTIKKPQLIINGDQNFDEFSAAYFPDVDSPVEATFQANTKTLEIILPINSYEKEYYADLEKLDIKIENPNEINNFLILDSQSINLLSKQIIYSYI